MTSTSRNDPSVIFVAVIMGLLAILFLRNCADEKDIKVRLASETTRVDYDDGVSCYHRAASLSCVYVPSRAPMGPAAPAVLVEDILEPDTDIIPKKRTHK